MSLSEWITAIKKSCKVAAVRAVPGRSTSSHCRVTGCEELETLGHLLGSCRHGELLHIVQSAIAEEIEKIICRWKTFEEDFFISFDSSTGRCDIIVTP